MDTLAQELQTVPNKYSAALDPFYTEIRHAEVLPSWLKLRHEIRLLMENLVLCAHRLPSAELQTRLNEINDLIVQFNQNVPNEYMQKALLTPANLAKQYDRWQ